MISIEFHVFILKDEHFMVPFLLNVLVLFCLIVMYAFLEDLSQSYLEDSFSSKITQLQNTFLVMELYNLYSMIQSSYQINTNFSPLSSSLVLLTSRNFSIFNASKTQKMTHIWLMNALALYSVLFFKLLTGHLFNR